VRAGVGGGCARACGVERVGGCCCGGSGRGGIRRQWCSAVQEEAAEARGGEWERCGVCVCARDPPTVPQVTDGRFGSALNQKSVQTMQKQRHPGGVKGHSKPQRTIRESLLSYSPKKAVFSTEYSFYVFVLFERSLANFTVIASHVGLMESWPEASLFGIQFPEPIPVAPQ